MTVQTAGTVDAVAVAASVALQNSKLADLAAVFLVMLHSALLPIPFTVY